MRWQIGIKKRQKSESYQHGINSMMISPKIQKDLSKCCAQEAIKVITVDIGDKNFYVLIDESCAISMKGMVVMFLARSVVLLLKPHLYIVLEQSLVFAPKLFAWVTPPAEPLLVSLNDPKVHKLVFLIPDH
jgi:hypothetical protein